jgi:hypothetical protein
LKIFLVDLRPLGFSPHNPLKPLRAADSSLSRNLANVLRFSRNALNGEVVALLLTVQPICESCWGERNARLRMLESVLPRAVIAAWKVRPSTGCTEWMVPWGEQ